MNELTWYLLHNAVIEPSGSGYRETDGWNLFASADEWVSPVHAEVGPEELFGSSTGTNLLSRSLRRRIFQEVLLRRVYPVMLSSREG